MKYWLVLFLMPLVLAAQPPCSEEQLLASAQYVVVGNVTSTSCGDDFISREQDDCAVWYEMCSTKYEVLEVIKGDFDDDTPSFQFSTYSHTTGNEYSCAAAGPVSGFGKLDKHTVFTYYHDAEHSEYPLTCPNKLQVGREEEESVFLEQILDQEVYLRDIVFAECMDNCTKFSVEGSNSRVTVKLTFINTYETFHDHVEYRWLNLTLPDGRTYVDTAPPLINPQFKDGVFTGRLIGEGEVSCESCDEPQEFDYEIDLDLPIKDLPEPIIPTLPSPTGNHSVNVSVPFPNKDQPPEHSFWDNILNFFRRLF